jgi:hypothetical protein
VYVWSVDIQNCQDATGISAAATPTTITTSNLGPVWNIGSGGATAGSCPQSFTVNYPTGLKATAPGTAVVFTLPAFITHQVVRLNVTWSTAPAQ